MKFRLLDLIRCPECGLPFHLTPLEETRSEVHLGTDARVCNECHLPREEQETTSTETLCRSCYQREITTGLLACPTGHLFPVANAIPRILPDALAAYWNLFDEHRGRIPRDAVPSTDLSKEKALFQKTYGKTMARFGYEWLRYPDYLDQEERAIFLNEVQIPERDFHERLVLDAGCGMGRFTRTAGQLGGEVVGIDISPSVEKAYEITRNLPCTHIIQGNIMQPPLRTGCFDIVYSLGVLHHTPDPKRSFLKLAQLAKEGGRVSVWVYGTAGRFKDFATNPLRKDRKIYVNSPVRQRIHWALVLIREALSDGVRRVTTRFPHTPLYFACHLLALVGKMPILKYLTASVHPHWRVRVLENFDWFSPPYQSHHTEEEILGWFEEAGLQEVTILPHGFIPKVGISGERANFTVPQPTA